MIKKEKTAKISLVCGSIGIIAVVITIICDFILIGRPNSSYSFFKLGTESMYGLSNLRIIIGTFVGITVIPLQIAGFIPVYLGLRPAGKIKSLIATLITCHAAIIAAAFHISYAFIASGWEFSHALGMQNIAAAEIVKSFDLYWRITLIILFVDVISSSILYTFLIIKKSTLFPKWMAFMNPACILLYTFFIVLPLPNPIGGFLAPAFLNISTLIFFILSTLTVYKKYKTN